MAAERQDFAFGRFLVQNRARKNCRPGCVRCRLFVKQIEKGERSAKEQEQQERQQRLEEQKIAAQERQD